jgi:hypothetical protein
MSIFNFNSSKDVDSALENLQKALVDTFQKMQSKNVIDGNTIQNVIKPLKELERQLDITKHSYGAWIKDIYDNKNTPPFPTKSTEDDFRQYMSLIIICYAFLEKEEGNKFLKYWGVDYHRETQFKHLNSQGFEAYIKLFEAGIIGTEGTESLKDGYRDLIGWMREP